MRIFTIQYNQRTMTAEFVKRVQRSCGIGIVPPCDGEYVLPMFIWKGIISNLSLNHQISIRVVSARILRIVNHNESITNINEYIYSYYRSFSTFPLYKMRFDISKNRIVRPSRKSVSKKCCAWCRNNRRCSKMTKWDGLYGPLCHIHKRQLKL